LIVAGAVAAWRKPVDRPQPDANGPDAANGTQAETITGTNTRWSNEAEGISANLAPPGDLFTVTGSADCALSAANITDNTHATVTLTKGSTAGTLTVKDNSTGATATFTVNPAPAASAVITEQNLPSNHNGNITVHAVGTNTSWTSSTTWTPSGVTGWSVASKSYVSPTSYTIVLTPPAAATPPSGATGTLTLTEGVTGSVAATISIGTPTLSLSPASGGANSTQSETMTGANTLWSSETAAGLFTLSGGSGASIGTISVGSNTSATAVLTKGSAAGTLTITDASTGATATFAVSALPSTGVVVFLGNSTTYGAGIPFGSPTYPDTVMAALNAANSGRAGYVVAEGGATIARMQSIFFDAAGGTQNSHYSAGNDNVVVILGGGSDLPTHTGAETWSYMQTFVAAAKAAGWRVVIASAAVNPGDTYETNRKAYHALVDANWYGFADAFAAWHTDPRVGPGATGANTTYYQDYNHPTSAGAAIYAEYVLLALEALGVYTPVASVDLSTYVLKSNVVSASYVVAGHDNYVGGSAGTYPTTATSQAAQLATDTAAVNAVKAKLQNDTTVLGVTGTFDLSTYTLKSNVVSAAYVVTGNSNYVGGSAGTYPTTATSQAAQLATDQAAVTAVKSTISSATTVLGVSGTLDLSQYVLKTDVVAAANVVTGYSNYAGGSAGTYPTSATTSAAQLATDTAAVNASKAKIQNDTIILGVTGTLDLSTYVLKSNVVSASYVVTGNSNYVGGTAGTYPTTATSQAAQLVTDQAAVNAVKAKLQNDTTVLGVTGTLDLSTHVLKTDVVSASNVVTGYSNYVGGNAGTYPTTAISQAAQFTTDAAAVEAKKGKIVNDTTILGVTGTLDLSLTNDVVLKADVVSAAYVAVGHENYLGGSAGT
jgi:HAMP domain-containing protein